MSSATDIRVTDCMTRDVISVNRNATLTEAIRSMEHNCLSALPVVDGQGCVCGVLSTADLIALTYEFQCDVSVLPHVSPIVRKTLTDALAADNAAVKVSNAMTPDVESISGQANLREAARKLIDNACHHLPVVDESKMPIGIISTTDIVRALADA